MQISTHPSSYEVATVVEEKDLITFAVEKTKILLFAGKVDQYQCKIIEDGKI
jgi:hypothetical protein